MIDAKHGDTVFVIGDSGKRRYHTFVTGTVSGVQYPIPLMSSLYEDKPGFPLAMTYGIIGSFSPGDSGSAVMNTDGYVIGMITVSSGDLIHCVTMKELSKAYEKIREKITLDFVGCTSHESALLGKLYWGGTSGKSRMEMYSISTAIQTPYFAVAHNGPQAHAFTFYTLWWEVFPYNDDLKEDSTQCMCELGSFTDIIQDQDGNERCGCADDACRKKEFYHKRSGEDNDRRWAIYKQTDTHYVPNQVSVEMINDLVKEIGYWQKNAQQKSEQEDEMISKYKTHVSIAITVAICAGLGLLTCLYQLYNRYKDTQRMLNEEIRRNRELTE